MTDGIKNAILALWATIAVSAFLAVIDIWSGTIEEGEFFFYLVSLALISIIPYKLQKGSNAARYVFLVLTAMNVLLLLGMGKGDMSLISFISSILMLPVYAYILLKLFNKDANGWFTATVQNTSN